jgi:hypothetical protein
LAPEQARNSIQDSLGRTATVETQPFLYRSGESKSLAALDTVLRVRIAAVQQAMSNLKPADRDG